MGHAAQGGCGAGGGGCPDVREEGGHMGQQQRWGRGWSEQGEQRTLDYPAQINSFTGGCKIVIFLILLSLLHLLAGIYFKDEPSFTNRGYMLTLMPRS